MKQHKGKAAGGAKDDPASLSAKLCSMKLIQLVRRNEALYNSDCEAYTDKNHKDIIWERIHRQLFPMFDSFSEDLKELIRGNVRRRWKTLRNAIAREVKKNATIENYSRKKESPIISELEFLIPHIKSAHCARLADELGLRESYTFMNDTTEEADEEDYNDLIDLTTEIDIKPIVKTHHSETSLDNSNQDGSCDSPPHEALYPAIQMNTSESSKADTVNDAPTPATTSASGTLTNNWSNAYCTVAQYKEGEFMNSNVLCAGQESDDASPASGNQSPKETLSPTEAKRRRIEHDEHSEWHAKILELLSHQDPHDEDRMFLLSLVSDLRRVPASRKMLVKAEIATAIARAVQP